jgi:hypothetical protein
VATGGKWDGRKNCGDGALLDRAADLVRPWAIANEVATTVDVVDAELLDPAKRGLERRHVGVDIRMIATRLLIAASLKRR